MDRQGFPPNYRILVLIVVNEVNNSQTSCIKIIGCFQFKIWDLTSSVLTGYIGLQP